MYFEKYTFGKFVFVLHLWIVWFIVFNSVSVAAQALSKNTTVTIQKIEEDKQIVVVLTSNQETELSAEIIEAMESQFSDLPILLKPIWIDRAPDDIWANFEIVSSLPEQIKPLCVIWFIRVSTGDIMLTIVDYKNERMLVRRLQEQDSGVQSEAVALISRVAVETLFRGGTIGLIEPLKDEEIQKKFPKPEKKEKKSVSADAVEPTASELSVSKLKWFGLGVGGTLQGRSKAARALWGLNTSLILMPMKILLIHGGYTFFSKATVSNALVQTEIARHPISVGAGFQLSFTRIHLVFDGTFVFDFVTQRTTDLANENGVAYDNRQWQFAACPQLRFRVPIISRLWFYSELGVEIELNKLDYAYRSAEGEIHLEKAWLVQPRIAVGLEIWIL